MSDLQVRPSLIITEREFGDVALAYTGGDISMEKAFEMILMAQQNLLAQKFTKIRQRAEEAKKSRPDIVVARPDVKIRER